MPDSPSRLAIAPQLTKDLAIEVNIMEICGSISLSASNESMLQGLAHQHVPASSALERHRQAQGVPCV